MYIDENDVVRFDEAETARFARGQKISVTVVGEYKPKLPGHPAPRPVGEIIDELIDWVIRHSVA